MQDSSNSSALAIELLQSCTKPSIYWWPEHQLYYFLLNKVHIVHGSSDKAAILTKLQSTGVQFSSPAVRFHKGSGSNLIMTSISYHSMASVPHSCHLSHFIPCKHATTAQNQTSNKPMLTVLAQIWAISHSIGPNLGHFLQVHRYLFSIWTHFQPLSQTTLSKV